MDINIWLGNFKKYWSSKDIDGILSLFSDNVVYFETPFLQLKSKEEIASEWQGIISQDDINLEFSIFSETENKSTILWALTYDKNGETLNYKGVYLVELDQNGMCKYFYQTCEERKD